MKKIFFLLAFAFIGQQAFSQMYMVAINSYTVGGCSSSSEITLTTITPTGTETHTCITRDINSGALNLVNQELNSILSQGYKLINIDYGYTNVTSQYSTNGLSSGHQINVGTTFYLAIP